MTNLKQKLLALAIVAAVSAGAFGQKEGKRPPKRPDTKVVVQEKGKGKPPKKPSQDRPKNDGRRGRP